MSLSREIRSALRKDPAVRRIIAEWRRLTGGARVADTQRGTLLACSGGADSSALVLALAASVSAKPKAPSKVKPKSRGVATLAVAHIVHDMRPRKEAEADRDSAARLAAQCGLPFFESSVKVRVREGNTEANARRVRYEQLAMHAARARAKWIATAHHADDQAETVLMRLIRGAGPEGLRGLLKARPVTPRSRLTLIRPMLVVGRAEAERICRIADWKWCEDKTNQDTTRLRSAIRYEVLPVLRRISPRAVDRMAATASLMAEIVNEARSALGALRTAEGLRSQAPASVDGAAKPQQSPATLAEALKSVPINRGPLGSRLCMSEPRARLRVLSHFALGMLIRERARDDDQIEAALAALSQRPQLIVPALRLDRLGWKHLRPVIEAIKSDETQKREFQLAQFTFEVGREVKMWRAVAAGR